MAIFDKMKDPFKSRQGGSSVPNTPVPGRSDDPYAEPSTGPLNTNAPQAMKQDEQLLLVSYTPEQQVQQVEATLSTIHFGMSFTRKFKENLSEFWSVAAPIVLFLGTVGEVYFFIYSNMTKAGQTPEWWVSLSILATVIALEFSFMVVSMKSDTIRNDIRAHGGGSALEKKDMRNHLISWFVLAVGVSIGQVSFLVISMMGGMNNMAFLIAFSVGRSVFTLAADFYVAFVHKEKPTTAEQAQMRLESKAKATKMLLEQKGAETTIINDGILRVREATTEAEIKHDSMVTRLKIEKLQNKTQVELLESQVTQNQLFTRMGQSFMQSIFDPDMDADKRQMMLGTMSTLAEAMKQLPRPSEGQRQITEEDDV